MLLAVFRVLFGLERERDKESELMLGRGNAMILTVDDQK